VLHTVMVRRSVCRVALIAAPISGVALCGSLGAVEWSVVGEPRIPPIAATTD
jgi:hypothetical protein